MVNGSASEVVEQWIGELADLPRDLSDADRVDLLRGLEELKSAAAAAQARLASDFDASQRARQRELGEPETRVGRGIAEQVALARRDSPHRGGRHLGMAKALVREMPHTLAALTRGRISEWRALLLVRETAYLERDHRAAIDAELAGPEGLSALETMSDQRVVAAAQRIAYRLDARAVTDRARRAEAQRRVTLRPAPDTMSYLTGLLPVAQGVACLAVLSGAADAARAAGDGRSRGQVMADTLVAALAAHAGQRTSEQPTGGPGRPTSWADADSARGQAAGGSPAGAATTGADVPSAGGAGVVVQLVMTDRALLAGDDEPAHLVGYGTVPAGWARDLLRDGATAVWLRRLYTHPATGDLLTADARARLFRGPLRDVLIARDQTCRTPWCDAPVRHLDHTVRHADGGPTSLANGGGRCARCNLAKEAPGWSAHGWSPPGDRHTVETTTPTGHMYRSRAPAPPGAAHAAPRRSRLEIYFADLVLAC